MNSHYVFFNIKDVSINAFVGLIDFKSSKYSISSSLDFYSDISKPDSYLIKNEYETESAILNTLDKLENASQTRLSKAVFILPDSCFAINKIALKHDFKFKLKPSFMDIFSMKKQTWQHFESKKANNEIVDIETIAHFNSETNEKITKISNEFLKDVISVNLAAYLKHDYIDKISTIVKNCNIKTSMIMPTSFAMHHGILNKNGKDTYLIINISHLESTSCIVGDLGIEKFSTIKFGIYSIALEIAKKFNINTRDANKILKFYLNGSGNIDYAQEFNIQNKPLLNKTILLSIEKLLEFSAKDIGYKQSESIVTKIIIDGEISKLDYTRNIAKDIFDKPTYLVHFDQEISEKEYNMNIGAIEKFIKNKKDILEIKNYGFNIKNKLRKLLHAVAFKMDNII